MRNIQDIRHKAKQQGQKRRILTQTSYQTHRNWPKKT